MSGCCSHDGCSAETKTDNSPAWRWALWVALAVNGTMFLGEIVAGAAAGSASLQADALDFLGDTANYAISLGVAGLGLAWRARAALLKGWGLLALGLWVLGSTTLAFLHGNVAGGRCHGRCRHRRAHRQCRRRHYSVPLPRGRFQHALGLDLLAQRRNRHIAVVAAAIGVFGTGTGYPDLIVAAIMAVLGISGGWQIIRQARGELRPDIAILSRS